MPKWAFILLVALITGTIVYVVALALQADPGMKAAYDATQPEKWRDTWDAYAFTPSSRPDVTCFVLTGSRVAIGGLSCFKESN